MTRVLSAAVNDDGGGHACLAVPGDGAVRRVPAWRGRGVESAASGLAGGGGNVEAESVDGEVVGDVAGGEDDGHVFPGPYVDLGAVEAERRRGDGDLAGAGDGRARGSVTCHGPVHRRAAHHLALAHH